MKLFIGTNNKHKIEEIKNILKGLDVELKTPDDLKVNIKIEEDAMTLEGNAFKKAKGFYDVVQMPVFADDTGLFIDLICGRPGVCSSRYAGENATYDDNCKKLLEDMKDLPEGSRTGEFKTVICYYENPESVHYFKGEVRGKILTSKRGENGFGYDPLFVPDEYDKTFAEMDAAEKNQFSHRARALAKFAEFLKNKKTGN